MSLPISIRSYHNPLSIPNNSSTLLYQGWLPVEVQLYQLKEHIKLMACHLYLMTTKSYVVAARSLEKCQPSNLTINVIRDWATRRTVCQRFFSLTFFFQPQTYTIKNKWSGNWFTVNFCHPCFYSIAFYLNYCLKFPRETFRGKLPKTKYFCRL